MTFGFAFDMGEFIKYLFLGMIQGITEVLPVSSSGHVELAKLLLNLQTDEGVLFLILLNTGSLLVFLVYFFKDLVRLFKNFSRFIFDSPSRDVTRDDFHFCLKVVVATIPAGIAGLVLGDLIDEMLVHYGGFFSGIGLLGTATVLLLNGRRHFSRRNDHITYKDALLIGLAQALTPLPGVSRSGITTVTALNRNIGIDSAIRFSFLLYIPVSVGSLALYTTRIFSEGTGLPAPIYSVYYAGAFLASVLFTAVAFRFIRPIFRGGRLKYFGMYCFVAGIASIVLFLIKTPL